MVKHYEFFVATQDEYYTEYIGDKVKEFVAESGVKKRDCVSGDGAYELWNYSDRTAGLHLERSGCAAAPSGAG